MITFVHPSRKTWRAGTRSTYRAPPVSPREFMELWSLSYCCPFSARCQVQREEYSTLDEALRTPVTPVSGAALTSLLKMIKQVPDNETNKPHKERLQQKANNAAQIAFAKNSLQQDHIRFLIKMNDESKPRRSTNSVVLGKAKVMSYEDLKEVREKRTAKDPAA